MIKNENKNFKETYYEDCCDNGLKIVVWHKPEFATTSCLFATPYGSFDFEQIDQDGHKIKFPEGIAHFLEHKLFESDEGDVMSTFSTMGANVNAFTSFNETVYYFDTSDEDIAEPLNLLLDFVQDLRITTESVEKEKGIIAQELNMYLEMPDSRLLFETFRSLYKYHPLKNDIGGTVESVYQITKENLEDCYAINYHPANMMVIVVTPVDPEKVIHLIKENQSHKTFPKFKPVTRYFEEEPKEVFEKTKTIIMDVTNQKICLGYKLPVLDETDASRVKRDWALRFILENHFTTMNPEYQSWIDTHQISHYFEYEIDLSKDYALLIFSDEGIQLDAFKAFIEKQLEIIKKNALNEDALYQLKNRSLGESLTIFNQPDAIGIQYFRNIQTGVSLFDTIEIISSLTCEDCTNALNNYNFDEMSEIVIKSK
ncbi:MAG: pitrilysin family protein [Anaerorhabdus sp.]|uniref:EF-P 5-aminopentanol modification-associated protein YfmH n=1 Tax=Anaerorhabdus sp. TaxID=1872524 RepID=UPI002FC9E024